MTQRTKGRLGLGQEMYGVSEPLSSHWRPATCKEVDCPHYLKGWITVVPAVGIQADYIRYRSERQFRERAVEGGNVEFYFPAGQRCFRSGEHKVKIGKPPLYLHNSASIDWEQWFWDFNEHAEKLNRERR